MWYSYSYLSDKLFVSDPSQLGSRPIQFRPPIVQIGTLKGDLKNLKLYVITVCNFRQYLPEAIDSFAVSLTHKNHLPPHALPINSNG